MLHGSIDDGIMWGKRLSHSQTPTLSALGFGWSSKALVDYGAYTIWADQLSTFIKEIIVPECGWDIGAHSPIN